MGLLGPFFKKIGFGKLATLKLVNILEWNFQEGFLIEIPWKWNYVGWAWQPFHACHAHFPKTLLFPKMTKKSNKFWKIQKKILHFLFEINSAFQWYIVCFHTFSGCRYTEGNVNVKSHLATTVSLENKPTFSEFLSFRSFER